MDVCDCDVLCRIYNVIDAFTEMAQVSRVKVKVLVQTQVKVKSEICSSPEIGRAMLHTLLGLLLRNALLSTTTLLLHLDVSDKERMRKCGVEVW